MRLLILEALGVLVLLLLMVWWTMFSGRSKGELPPDRTVTGEDAPEPSPSIETTNGKQH